MIALLAMAVMIQPEVVLGGQKQMVFGLKPEASQVLSYYIWVEEKANKWGDSTNVYAQRLGYTSSRVKMDIFNNQQVFFFETDARTKRDITKEFDAGVGASEQTWITKEGHIFRQIFHVEMPKTGERIVDAVYGTETVEISIKEAGKETSTTLYPVGGCKAFFDRFKPMIEDGKVVLKEKKFSVLDPYTLSIVPGSVTVGGRFDTNILSRRTKGNLFSIVMNGKKQRVYISDTNELVKVDLTDETYLQIDALPIGGEQRSSPR